MSDNEAARNRPYMLVSAPNQAGLQFIAELRRKGIDYYALVNNNSGKTRLEAMGVSRIITVDTADEKSWTPPAVPIGDIYLFEDSFNLSCRYLQICRPWTDKNIYVVTRREYSRLTYRALGANRLIHIHNNDIAFLLDDLQR
ncbi:hypothetical protein SD70_17345 [Gordoniibacillus kamchatkensis]|uniref:Uncharacterized protein n=1 Tax=Gordoniibacillus kamchatkensis TaxID=1590651 RepID=A0ABR5AG81_9BACL|nr:hypothetical protein [Paenibacillus sp. VKM B-2647]KIL39833.1 hypothetical protein SD70_17345 [Paenibacillus sp. VKM B-2647]